MTAITTRPVRESTDSLLRFALRADATLCGALGLFVAMAADPLSRLSGLSATSEWIAGAALVGYGVALYLAARCPTSDASAWRARGQHRLRRPRRRRAGRGLAAADRPRRCVHHRLHGRHGGLRLRPVPRSAPSGVTPSIWSGVAADRGCGVDSGTGRHGNPRRRESSMTTITTTSDALLRFAIRLDGVVVAAARCCDGRGGRTAVFAHRPADRLRVRRGPAQHRLRPTRVLAGVEATGAHRRFGDRGDQRRHDRRACRPRGRRSRAVDHRRGTHLPSQSASTPLPSAACSTSARAACRDVRSTNEGNPHDRNHRSHHRHPRRVASLRDAPRRGARRDRRYPVRRRRRAGSRR